MCQLGNSPNQVDFTRDGNIINAFPKQNPHSFPRISG